MLVPIKILLDEAKKPFVPYVTTNSVLVQDTDKTLQDELDNMYTKEETNELVNTGDANTLSSAKSYTDEVVNTGNTNTLNAAKEYTDEAVRTGDANTLNSAKEYTDDALANFEGGITEEQVDEKINTAKSDLTSAYTAADTTTLNSAKSYTDSKFNDAGSVVVNPIVTIKEALTFQVIGATVRCYNSALSNLSDGKMFTVTFPESDTTYTDLELYDEAWRGSGAGWKITNVQDYSLLSGQTCIVQARIADSNYTFTVVDVLTSTESVKKNLKDVLVTTCEATNIQHVAQTYYVYDEALRNPTHNQLFVITVPELGVTDETVYFYYTAQSGSYNGYLLTDVKSEEVSNQKILVQAKVVEDTTTFELVSILPTRNLILNKIDDYLITTCEATNTKMQYIAQTYYVYDLRLRNPAHNQLFIITIPELPVAGKRVRFWYISQSGNIRGYVLTNAKSNDISNQKILVQAKVDGNDTTFELVNIVPESPVYISDFEQEQIQQTSGSTTFYNRIYSTSFKPATVGQLFYLSVPELTEAEKYNVIRIDDNSETSYPSRGYTVLNAEAKDISGQVVLLRIKTVSNGTFLSGTSEIVGIVPKTITSNDVVKKVEDFTKEHIYQAQHGKSYTRFYSPSFVPKYVGELFIVQIPEVDADFYDTVILDERSETSYPSRGYSIINVKDVSEIRNSTVLLRVRSVRSSSSSSGECELVGVVKALPRVYDGYGIHFSGNDINITTEIGVIYRKNIFIEYNTKSGYGRFFGSFAIFNTSAAGNGDVTISLPTGIEDPDFRIGEVLYVTVLLNSATKQIDPMTIPFTWDNNLKAFKANPGAIQQNMIAGFIIPTQDLKIKNV